jgi:hypothetical protein
MNIFKENHQEGLPGQYFKIIGEVSPGPIVNLLGIVQDLLQIWAGLVIETEQ